MYYPSDETKNFGVIILMDDAAKASFTQFHASSVKSYLYSTVPGFCGNAVPPYAEYPELTVVSAFHDESILLQVERLLHTWHTEASEVRHSFCITLRKYDNTDIADRLLAIFDKVFFVDTESLLFLPVDIMEADSENCCAGIDAADVYSMISFSRKIYLTTSSHANSDSFVEACSQLQSAVSSCSNGQFNLLLLFLVPHSSGLEDIEAAAMAAYDTLPELNSLLFIPRFNNADDPDFHLATLICPHDVN